MYDCVLKNSKLLFPLGYERPLLDIAISRGKIIAAKEHIDTPAISVYDLAGRITMPGFVDTHLHLDTAYTEDDGVCLPRTAAYIRQKQVLTARYAGLDEDEIAGDMYARGARLLKKCAGSGTSFARTHITFNNQWGRSAMCAYERLKKDFADTVTLQNVVPYYPEYDSLFRAYAAERKIDVVGGCPALNADLTIQENYAARLRQMIAVAVEYGLMLDIHIETVAPDSSAILHTLVREMSRQKDYSLYERVAASHLSGCGDCRRSLDEWYDIAAACGKVYLSAIVQTSNEMVAAGTPDSRGVVPFEQFWDAGANICVASGDVRSSLHPFGNGNLLAEVLTTAQVHKRGIRMEMRRMLETITWNAARAMGLQEYGALPGCRADLVVLDAQSAEDALLAAADCMLILKNGRVVVNHLNREVAG